MVAIFWDYENCHPPANTSGYIIAHQIRHVALRYGAVNLFKAYFDFAQCSSAKTISLRSELQTSGVSLTDCPHNGKKDVADNMILVDMLSYAMDTAAPATIILITGDRDFAYAVSMLRLRQYRVVVIAPAVPLPHISLRSQASILLNWNIDVLGQSEQISNANRQDIPTHSRSASLPDLPATHSRPGQPSTSLGVRPSASPLQESSIVMAPAKGIALSAMSGVNWANRRLTTDDTSVQKLGLSATGLINVQPNVQDWVSVSQADISPDPSLEQLSLEESEWTEVHSDQEESNPTHSPSHNVLEVGGQDSVAAPTALLDLTIEATTFIDDEFTDAEILTLEPPKRPASAPSTTPELNPNLLLNSSPLISSRRPSTTSESRVQLVGRDAVPGHEDSDSATTRSLDADNHTSVPKSDGNSSVSPSNAEPPLPLDVNSSKANAVAQTSVAETTASHIHISNPTCIVSPPVTAVPDSIPSPSLPKSMRMTTPSPDKHSFSTLVDILRSAHQGGVTLPTCASVAPCLIKRDPTVYQQSGVTNFGDYAAKAQGAGLVRLGVVQGGKPWIALRSDNGAELPPAKFATLVDILNEERIRGKISPDRSAVAATLLERAPTVIQRAGVKTFPQYCALAEKAGIIQHGPTKGSEVRITLKTRWWRNAK